MKRHVFHREAEKEYADAAEYYARIDTELAGRFYDEIESIIRDIRRNPDRFRLFDTPIQRHFSTVFPFAVLYVNQPDRILIVAVMHMKRRPGYWKKRLD
ncbi:MAG TPA: type II toxin-antitoxin system RelE/ParE family toxin [Verrucomicrobiae bacterium]|nr:type II toxin-antitoxin system RelE/ParE family toxin [Verrucomicrobiae bacterium]